MTKNKFLQKMKKNIRKNLMIDIDNDGTSNY